MVSGLTSKTFGAQVHGFARPEREEENVTDPGVNVQQERFGCSHVNTI